MKKFNEKSTNNAIIRVVVAAESIFDFNEKSYIIPKNENLLISENVYFAKKMCQIVNENEKGITMDMPSWLFEKIPKTVIIS